jgi:8-oxo-dGTP pyrophosphatase MutT (NUDIX family)
MKTITCIAAEKGGKFLLLRRARQDTFPGLWEFPSGKVEEGESLEACARRELLEEAGLSAKDLAYRGKRERVNNDAVTLVHYFLAKNYSGSPKISEEHTEFGWFSKKEIMGMDGLEKNASPDMDSTGKVGTDAIHYFSLESSLVQTTLCIPVDFPGKRILLGMKKQGFGEGKWNGFGGKVKQGETPEDAALRELREEAGLRAGKGHLKKVGEFAFFFPHIPPEKGWDNMMHVFLVEKWEGEPRESREMRPGWFPFGKIPYNRMWQDDFHWLPLVLKGKNLKASFVFAEDNGSIHSMEMGEVKGFS